MSISLTLLFLCAISLSHAQLCGDCPLTSSSCVTATDKCSCFQNALACYNAGTGVACSASATTTCATAQISQCTLNGCTTVDPCIGCGTTYAQCVGAAVSRGISALCSCIGSYTNCLSTKCGASASITSSALCNSYAGTCPSLGCAAPTGCAKCSSDYTTCLTGPSASPCTCLGTFKTCLTDCGLPTTEQNPFDSSCLVYNCDTVTCSATANNSCAKCVSNYASCATNAIKTGGLGSTCSCLGSMFDCLTSSSCIPTAYNSLCPMLSPYCPDNKCGSSLKVATPKVDQIVNLIAQYKSSISQYLATQFSGSTFTFGATSTRANSKVVVLYLTTADPQTLVTLIEQLRTKLAEYFGIAKAKITIEASANPTKRDVSAPLQYNVVLDNSNSSGASAVVMSVFALVAALALLM